MAKLKYAVRDVFSVPLRDGGYAVGVIARMNDVGVLFGYFFGPRLDKPPGPEVLANLSPDDAVLVGRFGHLGLKGGTWKAIGCLPNWDKSQWPFPSLVRPEPIRGGFYLVTYDDDDPLRELDAKYFPAGVVLNGPGDGLMGDGFVEIRLTRLLAASEE